MPFLMVHLHQWKDNKSPCKQKNYTKSFWLNFNHLTACLIETVIYILDLNESALNFFQQTGWNNINWILNPLKFLLWIMPSTQLVSCKLATCTLFVTSSSKLKNCEYWKIVKEVPDKTLFELYSYVIELE